MSDKCYTHQKDLFPYKDSCHPSPCSNFNCCCTPVSRDVL